MFLRVLLEREVSKKDVRKTTFKIRVKSDKHDETLSSYLVECLHIYQRGQTELLATYPFVVTIDVYSRLGALRLINQLMTDIAYGVQHHDLQYTVDWWWRTPASSGTGPLAIGFRLCGLYEMVNT